MTDASEDASGDGVSERRFARLGRLLTSPIRRLLANPEDPHVVRARAMTDAELADALSTEIYAAQNADDEIWVEGAAYVAEAARRLRGRDGGPAT